MSVQVMITPTTREMLLTDSHIIDDPSCVATTLGGISSVMVVCTCVVLLNVSDLCGTLTLMIDLEEVSHIKGNATKGSTTDNATCDATSKVLIPVRPTAIATTMDGTRPIMRVTSRRKKGWTVLLSI